MRTMVRVMMWIKSQIRASTLWLVVHFLLNYNYFGSSLDMHLMYYPHKLMRACFCQPHTIVQTDVEARSAANIGESCQPRGGSAAPTKKVARVFKRKSKK